MSSASLSARRGVGRDLCVGAAVFAALAIVPFTGMSNYVLAQATLCLLWCAVVTQWNLVLGVAGILSIGNMAMFAAGGYAVALSGIYFGASPWATLPLAAVAGLVVSLIIGALTLRLRGPYVVVLTLAVAMVMYQLIVTDVGCFRQSLGVCYSFSGGARGLTRYGDFGLAKLIGYSAVPIGNYFVAFVTLLVGTVFAIVVVHSPYGRAFQAMRDNETAAACRGLSVAKYQLIIFAAAGFFTGLAGGAYAGIMRTFGPNILELPTLLFLLSMMIVGGRGAIWGPLLGAITVTFVDEAMRDVAQWRNTGVALVLIAILIFMPNGLAGQLNDLIARWMTRRKVSAPEPSASPAAEAV